MRLASLLPLLTIPALMLGSAHFITPAQAGFQWVPAENPSPAKSAPAPLAQSNDASDDVLVPMMIEPRGTPPEPANAPPRPLSAAPYSPAAPYAENFEANREYKEPDLPALTPLPLDEVKEPVMHTKKIGVDDETSKKPLEMPDYMRASDLPPLPPPVYDDNKPVPADAREQAVTTEAQNGVAKANGTPSTEGNNEIQSVSGWLNNETTLQERSWTQGKIDPEITPLPSAKEPAKKEPQSTYDAVEGFGSDLPLALALSQVVPPQYSYSFGSGVNPGARVSWNGGKPWDIVLKDMVAPLNVGATISGKSVILSSSGKRSGSQTLGTLETKPKNSGEKIKRKNILDPGNQSPVEDSILVPMPGEMPPPMTDDMSDALPDLDSPADLSSSYTREASGRTRMSETIEQEMKAENIQLRMRESEQEILAPVEPYKPGRKYDLVQTQDASSERMPEFASAQDMETVELKQASVPQDAPFQTVSQKLAVVGEEMKSANKVSANDMRMWEAHKGDSLKETLVNWSRDANINLVWNTPKDYTVGSNVLMNGTFKSAIKSIFAEGLSGLDKPPFRFVDNPNSNQPTTFIVGEGA